MSVAQTKAARRRMSARYPGGKKTLSVHAAVERERQRAMAENKRRAGSKKK